MILPRILFEDDYILVVDKPSGLTVNKSDTTAKEGTLQEWIENYLGVSKEGKVPKVSNGKESPFGTFDTSESFDTFLARGGIVHRIDKETSGILVVAKNPEAFSSLQSQFKERTVKKAYLALAHGKVAPDVGEINVPIGRLPWNRTHFGVVAGGRESVTRYRVISNFKFLISNEQLSLLELYPETGRTHQIRVHLKHINHPIFSDPLYVGRKIMNADRKVLPRMFLHANKISFTHPASGEVLSFESPLPPELDQLLRSLGEAG